MRQRGFQVLLYLRKKIEVEEVVTRLEIMEFDKQTFSVKPMRRERFFNLTNLILHLSVLLAILSF